MTDAAAKSALEQAWILVRRGEVDDARFWAAEAVSMDAELEEGWLILAALSDPHDSFEYLKRALEINPKSRRGKRGVSWAESKTGRMFADFLASFSKFTNPFFNPVDQEKVNTPNFDISAFADSIDVSKPEDEIKEQEIEPPVSHPEITEEPVKSEPTIIRRRKPRRPPPLEPVNPWSVLLPYTVSFVIFFFLASVWLLSGLPNVKAQAFEPTQSTEELVSLLLTQDPLYSATLAPMPTIQPTSTPTILPSITPTFTQQPTEIPNTETPPSPEAETTPAVLPIQFGEIVADTLSDGRWIEVDLANQKVRAYEFDTLEKEFLVSTGTAAHPTLKGNYHIYIKNRYADMHGPGYYLPNVPYTMYYYQSYGLHGTYWHHNFGTPMSHGCVNLQTDDAAWLFNFASIGTLVHVH